MSNQESLISSIKEIWEFRILSFGDDAVTVGSLVVGITAFLVGIFLAKLLSRRFSGLIDKKFSLNKSSKYLMERLFFYCLAAIGLLLAMRFANIPLTVFTVLGGAVAIGVGFGSQNLVNNFLSGLILMVEQPIKVGDYIEVESIFGEVEEIGIRSTSILTFGNRHIIIPNSSFLEKNVLNWTKRDNLARVFIKVGVNYGSDTEMVEKLLIQAVKVKAKTIEYKGVGTEVFFTEFGDNSLDFQVYFWIALENLSARKRLESSIRFEIDRLFRENDLVIAFPQRDVHLYAKTPIQVSVN